MTFNNKGNETSIDATTSKDEADPGEGTQPVADETTVAPKAGKEASKANEANAKGKAKAKAEAGAEDYFEDYPDSNAVKKTKARGGKKINKLKIAAKHSAKTEAKGQRHRKKSPKGTAKNLRKAKATENEPADYAYDPEAAKVKNVLIIRAR